MDIIFPSNPHWPRHLHHLMPVDAEALTFALSLPLVPINNPAANEYELSQRTAAIRNRVHALPRRLKAPLLDIPFLRRGGGTGPLPHLCNAHRGLHPRLMRSILAAVVAETTVRQKVYGDRFPVMSRQAQDTVHALRALQALWLPSRFWAASALDRWTRQPDGCAGCILARISADKVTLVHLRAALLSRSHRNRPGPRLLRWVDAAMSWSGDLAALQLDSNERSRELRRTRRDVLREKGKLRPRRHKSDKSMRGDIVKENEGSVHMPTMERYHDKDTIAGDAEHENDDGEQSDGDDFEEEIIDFYHDLKSSGNLAQTPYSHVQTTRARSPSPSSTAPFVGARAGWKQAPSRKGSAAGGAVASERSFGTMPSLTRGALPGEQRGSLGGLPGAHEQWPAWWEQTPRSRGRQRTKSAVRPGPPSSVYASTLSDAGTLRSLIPVSPEPPPRGMTQTQCSSVHSVEPAAAPSRRATQAEQPSRRVDRRHPPVSRAGGYWVKRKAWSRPTRSVTQDEQDRRRAASNRKAESHRERGRPERASSFSAPRRNNSHDPAATYIRMLDEALPSRWTSTPQPQPLERRASSTSASRRAAHSRPSRAESQATTWSAFLG